MKTINKIDEVNCMFMPIKIPEIPCETCGDLTTFLGTKRCNGCWEVETRLSSYLRNENAIKFVSDALDKAKRYKENGNQKESKRA